jgi:hypothetical protein
MALPRRIVSRDLHDFVFELFGRVVDRGAERNKHDLDQLFGG